MTTVELADLKNSLATFTRDGRTLSLALTARLRHQCPQRGRMALSREARHAQERGVRFRRHAAREDAING